MLESGGLEEAKRVLEVTSDFEHGAGQSIGYKEFAPYFSGECTL
jgi:tRNA A37 N6-isopentenylltransferase MiaA